MLKLDLNKATTGLKLSLEKRGIMTPPVVEVAFDLDVSGSFEDEHEDGSTNDLMTQLIPWGLLFDPDKKLDVFTFSSHNGAAHYVGDVNANNYENYIRNNIIKKVPGWCGGTEYAPVLRKNLEHFGWLEPVAEIAPKRGLFSGVFGRKAEQPVAATGNKRRSLVLFVTDGDNNDKEEAEKLLSMMEQLQMGVYIMFIGVSNQGSRFPFLEKMADRFSNTGLFIVKDLKSFIAQDSERLNEALITDELINWLK